MESEVFSDHNPQGCLTNSYLEMAEVLLQYLVLHKEVEMKFARSGVLSESMSTVAWSIGMADKAQSHTVRCPLRRVLTAVQRASQTGPLAVASIAYVEKPMSDVAYRRFEKNMYLTLCFSRCSPLYSYYRSNNPG